MAHRLAIAISGAVSLGCFEAGILYEVLRAIGEHNRLAREEDARIFVDVLTGASAGAMTAALAARYLLHEPSSLELPHDNPLYEAWVKRADIGRLLPPSSDPDRRSLLSSDAVAEIAGTLLTGPVVGVGVPHRAVDASERRLRLGFTLADVNGRSETLPSWERRPMVTYADHGDAVAFDLGMIPSPEQWAFIAQAARAAGAFPLAFRPLELERGTPLEMDLGGYPEPVTRLYTDGGTFDNQALALGRKLVSRRGYDDADRRYYLYISPLAAEERSEPLDGKSATLGVFLPRLFQAILEQARLEPWRRTQRINERVVAYDGWEAALRKLSPEALLALQPAVHTLLEVLKPGATAPERLREARRRMSAAFRREVKEIPESVLDPYLDALILLERASGLEDFETMRIFGITAVPEELVSDRLGSFLGFFEEGYRRHDYELGRQKARRWLLARTEPGALLPIERDAISSPKPQVAALKLPSKVTELSRFDQFRQSLAGRLGRMTSTVAGPIQPISRIFARWAGGHAVASLAASLYRRPERRAASSTSGRG